MSLRGRRWFLTALFLDALQSPKILLRNTSQHKHNVSLPNTDAGEMTTGTLSSYPWQLFCVTKLRWDIHLLISPRGNWHFSTWNPVIFPNTGRGMASLVQTGTFPILYWEKWGFFQDLETYLDLRLHPLWAHPHWSQWKPPRALNTASERRTSLIIVQNEMMHMIALFSNSSNS